MCVHDSCFLLLLFYFCVVVEGGWVGEEVGIIWEEL